MITVEQILGYQKKYRLASHLFFWTVIYLIGISSAKYHDGNDFTYRFAFIGNGLFIFPQILAAYFVTYLVLPGIFVKKRYVGSLLLFVTGSYLICLLARFLIVRVAEPLAGVPPKAFETNMEIITDIPKLVYVYFFPLFSIGFLFLFIKVMIQQLDVQRRALVLEKEKTETELKLLKSQLNPHFLFNTLNNIYTLALLNSPATSSSIGKLAEILDHILYKCNEPLVPLSRELALLNNYLELEKLRYNDRLRLELNTQVEHETEVPSLMLLSLAENAFKHGASGDIGNPVIEIDLKVDRERLCYSVVNSFLPKATENATDKIGLSNLRKQLEILYPRRYSLTTGHEQNIFHALLVIDIKRPHENALFDRRR